MADGANLAQTTQGILAAHALAAWLAALALLAAPVAWRGLRQRRPDRHSTAASTLGLLALAAMTWTWGPAALPSPFSTSVAVAAALLTAYVLLFALLPGQRWLDAGRSRLPRWLRRELAGTHEERRKGVHLLLGLYLAWDLGAGHLALALLAHLTGVAGDPTSNLAVAAAAPWYQAGHLVCVWFLYLITLTLAPVELWRLARPDSAYAWRRVIEPRLREREAGLFGAHLHMAVGCALAALLLAHDPATWPRSVPSLMAAFGVAVFADSASALVGMRWGRRKWPHDPRKSYAGTAAGLLVAILVAVPLVGVLPALALGALFVAVDLGAPSLVPISDNLLNPVGAALVLLALGDHVQPLVQLP